MCQVEMMEVIKMNISAEAQIYRTEEKQKEVN